MRSVIGLLHFAASPPRSPEGCARVDAGPSRTGAALPRSFARRFMHRASGEPRNQSRCRRKLLCKLYRGTQPIDIPKNISNDRFLTKLKEIVSGQARDAGLSARFPQSYTQNLWITEASLGPAAGRRLCPRRRNSILTRPAKDL